MRSIVYMKVTAFFVAAAFLITILPFSVYARQINNAYVVIEPNSNVVTIGGAHPDGSYREVTVSVSLEGTAEPYYWNGALSKVNGIFEFTYTMDSEFDKYGKYNVLVSGAGLTPILLTYSFCFPEDDALITSTINNTSDWTVIRDIINEKGKLFGIEPDKSAIFPLITDQQKVYESLCQRNFSNTTEIKPAFNKAIAIQMLNEATMLNAASVINTCSKYLGFDIGESSYYASLKSDRSKNEVYEAVTNKNLSFKDDVLNIFEQAAALGAVNDLDTSTRGKLVDYIKDFNSKNYVNISLEEFNSSIFNDIDRLNIVIAVINEKNARPFNSFQAFKQAFEKVVDDARNKINAKSVVKNRGGKVTKSISASSVPVIPTVPTADNTKSEPSFIDIANVPWAVESIQYLASKDIVTGSDGSIFEPDRSITREEFVKVLIKAMKIDDLSTNDELVDFTDVKKDEWYYPYIGVAQAKGIINGIDDKKFGIGEPITREQLCVMVFRAMQSAGIRLENIRNNVEFVDKRKISAYASEAVNSLYRTGVIDGVWENTFAPEEKATRAMTAKIIYGLLKGSGLK